MRRLIPGAYPSPPFPRIPKEIIRPPPHPKISPRRTILSEVEIHDLKKAAAVAASARVLAGRVVRGDMSPFFLTDLLKPLVSDEYADTIKSFEQAKNHKYLKSGLAYVDFLAHSQLTTHTIDLIVGAYIVKRGAFPSGVGFMGFPRASCTSVNEVVAHGIPDLRPLESGDILNVDLTCYLGGFFGDCSATFAVGVVDDKTKRLIEAPEILVRETVRQLQPGLTLKEVATTMDEIRTEIGDYPCIQYFCGHSIGKHLHEKPNIFHTLNELDEKTIIALGHDQLEVDQVLTIEPILLEQSGSTHGRVWPDAWTWVTEDGSRSAQHEEMIRLSVRGCEILTIPDDHFLSI